MSSELENSGIRVAVGDCSVTERRRLASALSNRQNCACARKTLHTQQGRTHGAGCVRQWFRTAEPLGERRYEIWNTHLEFYTDSSTRDMGTFIDIEMRQYMLLMYNSVKQRQV